MLRLNRVRNEEIEDKELVAANLELENIDDGSLEHVDHIIDPVHMRLKIIPLRPPEEKELTSIELGILHNHIERHVLSRRGGNCFHPANPRLILNRDILRQYEVDENCIQQRNDYLGRHNYTETEWLKYRGLTQKEYKQLLVQYKNENKDNTKKIFRAGAACLALAVSAASIKCYMYGSADINVFHSVNYPCTASVFEFYKNSYDTKTVEINNKTFSITNSLNCESVAFKNKGGSIVEEYIKGSKASPIFNLTQIININELIGLPRDHSNYNDLIASFYEVHKPFFYEESNKEFQNFIQNNNWNYFIYYQYGVGILTIISNMVIACMNEKDFPEARKLSLFHFVNLMLSNLLTWVCENNIILKKLTKIEVNNEFKHLLNVQADLNAYSSACNYFSVRDLNTTYTFDSRHSTCNNVGRSDLSTAWIENFKPLIMGGKSDIRMAWVDNPLIAVTKIVAIPFVQAGFIYAGTSALRKLTLFAKLSKEKLMKSYLYRDPINDKPNRCSIM